LQLALWISNGLDAPKAPFEVGAMPVFVRSRPHSKKLPYIYLA
jgi:hypothetical protein